MVTMVERRLLCASILALFMLFFSTCQGAASNSHAINMNRRRHRAAMDAIKLLARDLKLKYTARQVHRDHGRYLTEWVHPFSFAISKHSCTCREEPRSRNSICFYFRDQVSNRCGKTICRPTFTCVHGVRTGITCVRRKAMYKIISKGNGECFKVHEGHYEYVPYSSGYSPFAG